MFDVDEMRFTASQAREEIELTKLLADALVGLALKGGGKLIDTSILRTLIPQAFVGDVESLDTLKGITKKSLNTYLPDDKGARAAFHWCLEFPEVFSSAKSGFDAIIGNPPFLGGQRITSSMGANYRDYLVGNIAGNQRGSADLAAYFFLRSYSLLKSNACMGLIATNSIAQGDTREVGLERIIGKDSGVIYKSYTDENWPGKAAVITSRVYISKTNWSGDIKLNSLDVDYISSFLVEKEEWTPKRLMSNSKQTYQGSIILGLGFTISEEEAQELIASDPSYKQVLYPYLNGKDLNTNVNQEPSRWVINFFDWNEEQAKKFQEPYYIVREHVKPERDKLNQSNADGRRRKENWWKYGRDSTALYHAIGRGKLFNKHPKGWNSEAKPLEKILVNSRKGKYFNPSFIENDSVIADNIVVILSDSYADYALLNSNILQSWVWAYSSRLKMDLNFSPSDAYETLPFPVDKAGLENLGLEYEKLFNAARKNHNSGKTKLINLIHEPKCLSDDICCIRELHKKLDNCVLMAYGWNDLELEHGFHQVGYLPEGKNTRFTISERARTEVLFRLAMLNKSRYEAEQ
ncbi:Eco57I restriction-modification methylase domain-containing protein [Vibrio chaetopteri]|uniref:Eco57I restriction-modification methylase domain-containing protein n=1 Tax=Vibrio chaetopteri TaxID=3016528 RepID=UPI003AB82CB7